MRLLSLFLIVGLLSACSTYQYVTLSNTSLKPGDKNEYVFETDSVKVSYSFEGANCPVWVKVFNKLDKPLYVDWSKSAVIINGERRSYYQETAIIDISSSNAQYRWTKNYSNSYTASNGKMVYNERVTFIPPQSFVNYQSLLIRDTFFPIGDPLNNNKTTIVTESGNVPAKKLKYDEAGSPFRFRSFLTMSTDQHFASFTSIDHTFWVSEVVQVGASPKSITKRPSNQFYMKRTSDAGTFLGIVTLVGILGGLAALSKGQ